MEILPSVGGAGSRACPGTSQKVPTLPVAANRVRPLKSRPPRRSRTGPYPGGYARSRPGQAGDLDAAAESARAAVAGHGSSPLRELARSLLALGRIERRRKARRQSRDALSQARKLAAAIGHKPLLAEIEQELPRIAPTRSGSELTATEQRVADLIAAGATNRDAAAELFVSVRTVETHVASIYRKLGVRTRAELARKLPASQ